MIDLRSRIPSGYTGRFTIPNLDEVEAIAVHHSVSGWVWNPLTQQYTGQAWNEAVDVPQEVEIAHLLAIDRWHTSQGYGGFGYHMAAFPSGRRYLCGSLNTARAHVASLNKYFLGLVLIGDFTDAVPLDTHLVAASGCVGYAWGELGRELPCVAHRMIRLQNTTCPGNRWREWLPLIEKEEDMITIEQEIAYKEALGEELEFIDNCLSFADDLRFHERELAFCTWPRGPGFGTPPPDWETFRRMAPTYRALITAAERGLERCSIYGRPG